MSHLYTCMRRRVRQGCPMSHLYTYMRRRVWQGCLQPQNLKQIAISNIHLPHNPQHRRHHCGNTIGLLPQAQCGGVSKATEGANMRETTKVPDPSTAAWKSHSCSFLASPRMLCSEKL